MAIGDLPDGFVVDQASAQQGGGSLPDGFVVNAPAGPKPFYDAMGASMTQDQKDAHPVLAGIEQTAQDVATLGEKAVNGLTLGGADYLLNKNNIEPPNFDNTAPENKSALNLGGDVANLGAAGKTIGTGAKPIVDAVAPVVGKAIDSAKNKIAEMALSPEFSQTKSAYEYGHDARRVLTSMPDVVGSDVNSSIPAVENKLKETGQAIGDTMINHPQANTKLDATDAIIKPFDDRISELNQQNPDKNSAVIQQLQIAKKGLLHQTDADGKIIGVQPLDSMTPKQLFDYRQQKIDPMTRYTGNVSDDATVNAAYQEAKSNIRNMTNQVMPELKPLNKDYGDLSAASDALHSLAYKSQKEGIGSLKIQDIATLGLNKYLANPINRVKFAQFLYTAPKSQITQIVQKTPNFGDIINSVYGENKPSLFQKMKSLKTNNPS